MSKMFVLIIAVIPLLYFCNATTDVKSEMPLQRLSSEEHSTVSQGADTWKKPESTSSDDPKAKQLLEQDKPAIPSSDGEELNAQSALPDKSLEDSQPEEAEKDDERASEVDNEKEIARILQLDGSTSTSLGSCGNGTLVGGVALPKSGPGFQFNPRRPQTARFGTVETVKTLIRSAGQLADAFPGSILMINDLCNEGGGPIRQHGSHQTGLDVDILYFYLDAKGKPVPSVGVPVDPRGWGWDFKDLTTPKDDVRLKVDVKRTWRYMHALLENSEDRVQRIFIVEHLRTMLLQEAERVKAPRKWVERFELVTCQPGTPHDDHMHVRFYCTAEDILAGCTDKYPMYYWRRQALKKLNVEPVMARADPKLKRKLKREVKKRTTTAKQARKKAGRMHIRVRRFLDQRESWLKQPHPGRPFCR